MTLGKNKRSAYIEGVKKFYVEHPQVIDFMATQAVAARAIYRAIVEHLRVHGRLTEPDGKKIGDNLFEIRITSRPPSRIIYCYAAGDSIFAAHAFTKKTQKTPLRELALAQKRIRNFTS